MTRTPRKSPTLEGQLELGVIIPAGDSADCWTQIKPLLAQVEGMLVRTRAMVIRAGVFAENGSIHSAAAYRGAVTLREGRDPGVMGVPPLARTQMGLVQ